MNEVISLILSYLIMLAIGIIKGYSIGRNHERNKWNQIKN